MRSKADISHHSLPHGTRKIKSGKKLKSKKWICSEVSVNSPENPWSHVFVSFFEAFSLFLVTHVMVRTRSAAVACG